MNENGGFFSGDWLGAFLFDKDAKSAIDKIAAYHNCVVEV